jgi:hypothetical protein
MSRTAYIQRETERSDCELCYVLLLEEQVGTHSAMAYILGFQRVEAH